MLLHFRSSMDRTGITLLNGSKGAMGKKTLQGKDESCGMDCLGAL